MTANINFQNNTIPDAVTGTWYEVAPKAAAGAPVPAAQATEAATSVISKHNTASRKGVLHFLSKWLH